MFHFLLIVCVLLTVLTLMLLSSLLHAKNRKHGVTHRMVSNQISCKFSRNWKFMCTWTTDKSSNLAEGCIPSWGWWSKFSPLTPPDKWLMLIFFTPVNATDRFPSPQFRLCWTIASIFTWQTNHISRQRHYNIAYSTFVTCEDAHDPVLALCPLSVTQCNAWERGSRKNFLDMLTLNKS